MLSFSVFSATLSSLCKSKKEHPRRDGASKNDCERRVFSRFLHDLKKEHPQLKLTMCSDALSSTAPHINELKSFGYDFLTVVKPEGNRSLFEWVKGITREVNITVGKNLYIFRYVNNVPLNDTNKILEGFI